MTDLTQNQNQNQATTNGNGDLAEFFIENDSADAAIDDDAAHIGERISEARAALGISVSVLAERLAVTAETIEAWESGENAPRANHLNKVAGILGIGLSWLIIGHGAEPQRDASDLGQLRADLAAARSRLDDVVNELTVLDQRLALLDHS